MKKQTNVRDEMREALYKRAIGYEVEETKIIVSKDGRPAKIEKIMFPGNQEQCLTI